MGLFEETVVKAKDALDVAAKKTNEVIESQKLKLKVAQLKSQVSKEYETLGRLYYDSVKSQIEIGAEADETIKSIDDKLNDIQEIEADIEAQKDYAVCPTCGNKCPQEAVFCSNCGAKVK